ncbi:DnaJ domain protein [Gregarina niphandrodes]|uniref:DnaJ domain protein n=1 Tax=Gregarina niphandrodes TaxID=110365 RepID=A0A023B5Z1_GRENI|nr:DnaJ domain protein [Gregarina niphandrodes]EZG63300.1 DnaJ domain protein [Gregarina niphandrodes]|eukprot:XP_011130692.1 DnaJ domain protein [Gregarina niphandrodes]
MSEPADFYARLGVSKDAPADEIRKAYRKLALKWHPDKNPNNREEAETKFKELAEAYDCLSDPDKRRRYDLYGPEGGARTTSSNNGGRHGSGGFGGFGGFGGPHSQRVFFTDPFAGDEAFGNDMRFTFDHARRIFENVFGTSDPFRVFEEDPFFNGAASSGFGGNSGFGNSGFGGFGGLGLLRTGTRFNNRRGWFGDPFGDPFGSPFGSPFSGLRSALDHLSGFQARAFDNADDDVFRSFERCFSAGPAFGGGFSMASSSSSTMQRGPNGESVTVTTRTTKDHTGQTRTETERVVQHPDGRVERTLSSGGSPASRRLNDASPPAKGQVTRGQVSHSQVARGNPAISNLAYQNNTASDRYRSSGSAGSDRYQTNDRYRSRGTDGHGTDSHVANSRGTERYQSRGSAGPGFEGYANGHQSGSDERGSAQSWLHRAQSDKSPGVARSRPARKGF